jgi:hypothetical protein
MFRSVGIALGELSTGKAIIWRTCLRLQIKSGDSFTPFHPVLSAIPFQVGLAPERLNIHQRDDDTIITPFDTTPEAIFLVDDCIKGWVVQLCTFSSGPPATWDEMSCGIWRHGEINRRAP